MLTQHCDMIAKYSDGSVRFPFLASSHRRLIWLVPILMAFLVIQSASGAFLTFVGVVQDGVGGVDGLRGVNDVAISPDGNHLYAAGYIDDAVAIFARNPTTGGLMFVQVQKNGMGGSDGLNGAEGIAVSPDGKHVYVASGFDDHAVATFNRDAVTGTLSFVQVQKDGVAGVDGLRGARGITISRDGKYVYIAGSSDSAVAVFSRDSTTGALTFVEVQKDGVNGVDGLLGAQHLALSPDDKYLYVTGFGDDAIAVFSRNATTGALTFVKIEKDNPGGVNNVLDGPIGITISSDGRFVYVGATQFNSTLVTFSRDVATGALTIIDVKRDGVGGVDGLAGVDTPVVSPDGDYLYVTAFAESAVAVFSREKTTGMLSFVEAQKNGTGGVNGLQGASGITVSPDGGHIYVGGGFDNAVAIFRTIKASGHFQVYLPLIIKE